MSSEIPVHVEVHPSLEIELWVDEYAELLTQYPQKAQEFYEQHRKSEEFVLLANTLRGMHESRNRERLRASRQTVAVVLGVSAVVLVVVTGLVNLRQQIRIQAECYAIRKDLSAVGHAQVVPVDGNLSGVVFNVDPTIEVVCDGQRVSKTAGLRYVSFTTPKTFNVEFLRGHHLVDRELVAVTGRDTVLVSPRPVGEFVSSQALEDVIYADDKTLDLGSIGEVKALAFTPDDERVIVAGGNYRQAGAIKLMDLVSRKPVIQLLEPDVVSSVAVDSSQGIIAWSVSNHQIVRVHRLIGNRTEQLFEASLDHAARLVISPDGKTLAAATEAGTVYLWSLDNPTEPNILLKTNDDPRFHTIKFSPDGKYLIVAGGRWTPWGGDKDYGQVKVFDTASGEVRYTVEEHRGTVLSVAVSPDNRVLATAGVDRTIKLWDLATGELQDSIAAHDNVIEAIVFSPGGSILASGGWDNTVKLWNPTTMKLMATMKRHTFFVQAVAFSGSGEWLAASGADGSVRFWNIIPRKQNRT